MGTQCLRGSRPASIPTGIIAGNLCGPAPVISLTVITITLKIKICTIRLELTTNLSITHGWLIVQLHHTSVTREAFVEYSPMTGTTFVRVGNVKTVVKGHRTIELESTCKGYKYVL